MALTIASRDLLFDWLRDDLPAALRHLSRRLGGDFSPDGYTSRFAKTAEMTDSGASPWELFELWVTAGKPSPGTVENWRYMLRSLDEHFEGRSAGSASRRKT